eukprot:7389939-Prymnesium_polylepis.2
MKRRVHDVAASDRAGRGAIVDALGVASLQAGCGVVDRAPAGGVDDARRRGRVVVEEPREAAREARRAHVGLLGDPCDAVLVEAARCAVVDATAHALGPNHQVLLVLCHVVVEQLTRAVARDVARALGWLGSVEGVRQADDRLVAQKRGVDRLAVAALTRQVGDVEAEGPAVVRAARGRDAVVDRLGGYHASLVDARICEGAAVAVAPVEAGRVAQP